SQDNIIEHSSSQFRSAVVVRQVEHVRAVKREDAPTSSSSINRVCKCSAVAFVDSHRSKRFAKCVRGKVLKVLTGLMAQCCLQRVIRRGSGELIEPNILISGKRS